MKTNYKRGEKIIEILVGIVSIILCSIIFYAVVLGPFFIQVFVPIKYQQGKFVSNKSAQGEWVKYQENDIIWENKNWSQYNPLGETPEKLDSINNLLIDNADRIWLPTDGHGLFMFDGAGWHHWWYHGINDSASYDDDEEDALRGLAVLDNQVYAIASSSDRGYIIHYDLDAMRWEYPWRPDFLNLKTQSYQITTNSQKHLYFLTNAKESEQLAIFGDGKVSQQNIICSGAFPQPMVVDTNDHVWIVGGYSQTFKECRDSIFKFANKQFTRYQSNQDDVDFSKISFMNSDQNGHLLIITENNQLVIVDEHDTWYISNLADFLPIAKDDRIRDMVIDSSQRIWLLTFDNLIVYNGKSTEIMGMVHFFS